MITRVNNMPFLPTGDTYRFAPTAMSQTFDMQRRKPRQMMSVRIVNKGPDYCAITFGGPGTSASFTRSLTILPDSIEVFSVIDGQTHIAIISEGATNEVQITEGTSS